MVSGENIVGGYPMKNVFSLWEDLGLDAPRKVCFKNCKRVVLADVK